ASWSCLLAGRVGKESRGTTTDGHRPAAVGERPSWGMRVWPCIPHESGEILACSRHRSNSRPDTPFRDDAAGRQRFPATPRRARTLLPNPSANAFDRERERETPNCTGASREESESGYC